MTSGPDPIETEPSLYDRVTGLPSAAMQQEHLRLALKRADRSGSHVALLFLDLDDLHEITETLGRHVGDALLAALAARLRTKLRDTDVIARLEGDEFAIVCEELARPGNVGTLVRRVNEALFDPIEVEGNTIVLRGTIGSAVSEPAMS
jgi:diguanylate cyclase (GGDEF)-like protein